MLSNVEINQVLKRWSQDTTNQFVYYSCQFSGFHKEEDEIKKIDWIQLQKNRKCLALVVNSLTLDEFSINNNEMNNHWICFFIDVRRVKSSNTVEYFDSLDIFPLTNNNKDFLHQLHSLYELHPIMVANKRYQKKDYTCGHFCLYYIDQRIKHKKIKTIDRILTKETMEEKIETWFHREFSVVSVAVE